MDNKKKETQMKLKNIGLALGAAALLATTGCMNIPVSFSDKSVPIEQGKYTVVGDEVLGEDHQIGLLGFPVGMPGSGQRRALKNAMSQAPGADGLVSVAVDFQQFNVYLFQIWTTKVSGTPVKTK